MNRFQCGETIRCQLEVRRLGVLYDPVTGVHIIIHRPDGIVDLTSTPMLRDSIGRYSFFYQTATKSIGVYRARVTVTDGANVTIMDGTFQLD